MVQTPLCSVIICDDTFLSAAVDQCLSSPCKNGATCTRRFETYACKCAHGFHGHNCDKGVSSKKEQRQVFVVVTLGVDLFAVRLSSNGCRYKNGGCEHFCREFPDRSYMCFCAPGYGLDQDNSTCLPQGKHPKEDRSSLESDTKKKNVNRLFRCPFELNQTAAYLFVSLAQ